MRDVRGCVVCEWSCVCVRAHARTHTHTCTHARIHAHTHARTHARTHTHKHIHTRSYAITCTHARAHTQTCTHAELLLLMTPSGRLQAEALQRRAHESRAADLSRSPLPFIIKLSACLFALFHAQATCLRDVAFFGFES